MRRSPRPVGFLFALLAFLVASLLPSSPRAAAEPLAPKPQTPGAEGVVEADEPPERRTRTSRTFRTPRGFRTEFSSGSLHYQDAAGNWHPVDTTLVPSGAGFVTRADDTRVQLPASARDGVVVTEDGAWLSFRLRGASGAAALVSGRSAAYRDVLPGVDLAYHADADSLKETLTLEGPGTATDFTFELSTSPGLRLVQQGDSVVALDEGGGGAFSLLPPFMDDAAGAHSDAVTMALGADGRTLTLVADRKWLADPQRVYPVVIDPTVSYLPTVDCSIHSATPLTSDCVLDTFAVGSNGGATRHRGLLSFPEASTAIRESAVVLDAVLSLTQTGSTTEASVATSVHGATKPWNSSATWNTHDGTTAWSSAGGDWASSPVDTRQAGSANTRWDFYPRDLVQGWVDGSIANHGMLVKTDEAVANEISFASSEALVPSSRPTLSVEWVDRLGLRDSHKYDEHRIDDRTTVNVDLANGNMVLETLDLRARGTGLDVAFRRYNNNQYDAANQLGLNWTASVGPDVRVQAIGDRGVAFTAPSNMTVLFEPKAGGGYETPAGVDATLTKDHTDDGPGTYRVEYNKSKEKLVFKQFASIDFLLWKNIDRNDNTITYAYDGQGEWDSVTDTQGRVFTISHDLQGNISKIEDSSGRAVSFVYDLTNNRLTSITNADNKVTTYQYNSNGNLTRITTATGRQTKIAYNDDRVVAVTRVTNVTNDTGPTTTYDWDVNRLTANQASFETDTAGWAPGTAASIARSTAQADHGLASLAATSGGTSMEPRVLDTSVPAMAGTSYSARASVRAATVGAQARVVLRWIDSAGGLISTSPGAAVTNTTSGWTPISATGVAPSGATRVSMGVSFPLVASGAVHYIDRAAILVGRFPRFTVGWAQSFPDECKALFAARVSDGRGHSTVNCSDKSDLVKEVKDALGHRRSTTYTANENVTTFTGDTAAAGLHTLNYDGNNNLKSIVAPPSDPAQTTGATTTLNYPGAGLVHQPDSRTDAQGNCRAFAYDTPGNLVDVYDGLTPNGAGQCAGATGTIHFKNEYNDDGTLEWQQAPGGDCTAPTKVRCTTYTYTYAPASPGPAVLERMVVTHPAPLGAETAEFDHVGRAVKLTDGRGEVTRLAYDALDRVTQALYDDTTTCSSSATCTSWTYDADGNVSQRVDNTGTTTFTYDLAGRMTKKATPDTASHCSDQGGITFAWDAAGNMSSMCDAGGPVTYQYNEVNNLCWLLVGTATNGCAAAPPGAVTFAYDNDDRRTSTTYPTNPAVVMSAEYFPSGHVKKIEATKTVNGATTVLSRRTYAYAAGTKDTLVRQRETDGVANTVVAYTYDPSNRLTRAQTLSGGTADYRYDYDDNSNRKLVTVGGVTTTYEFNQANQLISGAPTTPEYDRAGNETRGPNNRRAEYNAKGQTAWITPPGGTTLTFTYADADSTERTTAGSTNYADTPLGIALSHTTGARTNYTRDSNGTLVSQRRPDGSVYYYVFDALGSVLHLVDSSANVAATYSYDPYGGTTASGPAAAGNPFRFVSGHLDSTGLYKFGTRYYDAAYGRWTQRDPIAGDIGTPITINRYAYVGCDPVNDVDPSGRLSRGTRCGLLVGATFIGGAAFFVGGVSSGGLIAAFGGGVLGAASTVAYHREKCDDTWVRDVADFFFQ